MRRILYEDDLGIVGRATNAAEGCRDHVLAGVTDEDVVVGKDAKVVIVMGNEDRGISDQVRWL